MRDGPAKRQKAHGHRDTSLAADMGRGGGDGDEPVTVRQFISEWRGFRTWVIRLGISSESTKTPARRRYVPPATDRQIACIVALTLKAGRKPDIPARLSLKEASAIIDELRAEGDG